MVFPRPDGLLKIPAQFNVTQGSFDVNPKNIDAWISQLPLANAAECARLLSSLGSEINSLDIPKRHRQKILELLIIPTIKTTETLKLHFISQSVPLAEKYLNSARLAQEISTQIATGYNIIIEQSWHTNVSLIGKKNMALLVYRSILFLSEVLLIAYETYSDPPQHTWFKIHQLYAYAQECNLAKTHLKLETTNGNTDIVTIDNLYKRIILISLISPYRLRQNITEKIYKALSRWANYSQLMPILQSGDQATIDLNSDNPPYYYSPDTADLIDGKKFTIDASELIEHLNEIMLRQPNIRDFSEYTVDIPYNIIKILLLTWSGRTKRAFLRSESHNKLGITIGLSATHYYIHKLEQEHPENILGLCESATAVVWDFNLNPEQITQHSGPRFEVPANFINLLHIQNNNSSPNLDIWDPEFINKNISNEYNLKMFQDQKLKSFNAEMAKYNPHDYNNINESAGGYCLVGLIKNTDHSHKVKIGEIVGLCDNTETMGSVVGIGVVRRVKCSDRDLTLGIQKLTPCAEAIAICAFQPNISNEKYYRGLVLPELKSINQPVTLLTHNLHNISDRLVLNKQGYRTVVKLTKLLESTDVFAQYEFEICHVEGFKSTNSEGLSIADNNQSEWSIL